MNSLPKHARFLILALAAAALVATSGCSMFRGKTGYELPPESRPLSIPPDLDAPATGDGLRIPAAPVATAAAAAPAQAFTLSDTPASAFGRVGIALDRIEGVSISERSQLLGVYTVAYEGETFFIRISPEGQGARIAAASTDGREINSGAGARLLGLLRQRLG
ncbi:MAG TPA: hypothetical protein PKE36_08600 [Chiayiivirga sp.]|mgnify:FL=1|nr:hypothetical protein [Chiayiivirga sp.]